MQDREDREGRQDRQGRNGQKRTEMGRLSRHSRHSRHSRQGRQGMQAVWVIQGTPCVVHAHVQQLSALQGDMHEALQICARGVLDKFDP
jgi:hypothetical protein